MSRVFSIAIAFATVALPQTKVPLQSAEDLARGKQLYEAQCAGCHGQTGEGGRGPSLRQPKLRRAPDDAALFDIIQDGIPNSEMPGMWYLSEREIRRISGYLRAIGRTPVVNVPFDVNRGREIFDGKGGCAACHIAEGRGAAAGPELTDIGARRSPEHLRESLVNPAASAPEGFLIVEAAAAAGPAVRGVRLNEDTFTIQIRDEAGHFHSLRKNQLRSLKRQEGKSPMPSYSGKLTESELGDVVAYLASLRGGQ